MKLLGTPASPYVRKVRLVLEEKHIPYEYVLASPSQREAMVVALNPLGKVPVLVCDDGRAIYDSPVIVDYLDGLVAEPELIPRTFDERIEVKRWEALGDGIADATVLISHDYRKPEARRETRAKYQLYLYARALSARTRIPLSRFGLAYFDDRDYFEVSIDLNSVRPLAA
jgi:glutathione S-transferase